jgi:hypothetical protein
MPFDNDRNKEYGRVATETYKTLSSFPSYSSAELTISENDLMHVRTTQTVKNFDRNEKVQSQVDWLVSTKFSEK